MTKPLHHNRLAEALEHGADELLDLHRRLVQSPSVNRGDGSPAGEDAVARIAADYLAQDGIASLIVESAPGRANLLARIGASPTTDDHKTLLLMSHGDVVPAGDPSLWRFPPFSAKVAEGRVWGRGAYDCKMLAACELFTMATLHRLDLIHAGEVRLALGADEEAGGQYGFGWLARHEADFLRADLAINEGGGACLGLAPTGERLFTVGCGEKGRYEVTLKAHGPGSHASIPWGKTNPLVEIGAIAAHIGSWEGNPCLDSPIFERLRDWLGLDGPVTLANLDETLEAASRLSHWFASALRAQSRITLVPTMAASGEKSNAVPLSAEIRCDARIPPTRTIEDLERVVQTLLAKFPEIEAQIDETAAPSVSPIADRHQDLFERALNRTFHAGAENAPRCQVAPTWTTGFTDSRFARLAGTPTYGFQVVNPAADPDRLPIHCIDESIEVGMLVPCARVLGHLALDFIEAQPDEARPHG